MDVAGLKYELARCCSVASLWWKMYLNLYMFFVPSVAHLSEL